MFARQKRFLILFFLMAAFTMTFTMTFAVDVDPRVTATLENEKYVHVIVLVEDSTEQNTKQLLAQESFVPGADISALKKVLSEKKRAIRKQQYQVLREINIEQEDFITNGIDADLLQRKNVDLVLDERFSYISGFSGVLTRDGYKKILRDPNVVSIYLDEDLHLLLDSAIPFVNGNFGANISINGSVVDGSGIGICIIDTGVDINHSSISDNIIDQYCYCSRGNGCCPNGASEDTNAFDDNGHGTSVIGTIVSNDSYYKGIAPGASIMVIKAFDSSGGATTSDVLAGITKCLEKADDYNIKVFSFSFGGTAYNNTCNNDSLASISNELVSMGFFVAAASGNNGYNNSITTPACGSNVTSVGTVYDNSSSMPDTIASFSNAASFLDILAPGVNICTPKAFVSSGSSCYTSETGDLYRSVSGTSFSAPLVAGAGALVAQYKVLAENTVVSSSFISSALTTYGKTVLDSRNGLLFPRLDVRATLQGIDISAPSVVFVFPTPDNDIILNNTNVTINVSATDLVNDITLCTLAHNGTNSTMTIVGSGRNVSCFIDIEAVGTQTYSVFAVDNNGNRGTTETRTFRVNNTAPIIVNYSPENLSVILVHPTELNFSVVATDTDNDIVNYTWLINESVLSTLSSFLFSSASFIEGNHTLSIIVSDDIANATLNWTIDLYYPHSPFVYNVTIEPSHAYNNNTLNCHYTFSDPDGDSENGTAIYWYRNNIPDENLTNISFVHANFTTRGENWFCTVRPSDGKNEGEIASAEPVVIANYIPIINISGNTTVQETEPVVLYVNVSDEDNDTIMVSINDSRFDVDNNTYILNTTTNSSSIFSVLFYASDGYDNVEEEITISIIDVLDSDGDGIPDNNDDDDDNDGSIDTVDCQDTNAAIYPGAKEIADNGIDEDCDGKDLITVSEITGAATAGAAGGGGGGPTKTKETVEEHKEEYSQSDATQTEEHEEINIIKKVEEFKEVEQQEFFNADVVMTEFAEGSEKSGFFTITGAAVGDLVNGELTFASIVFVISIILIFCSICTIYWYLTAKRNKTFQEFAFKEILQDFVTGIKEWFKK